MICDKLLDQLECVYIEAGDDVCLLILCYSVASNLVSVDVSLR